jgi:hypothetical protein
MSTNSGHYNPLKKGLVNRLSPRKENSLLPSNGYFPYLFKTQKSIILKREPLKFLIQ